MSLKAFNFKKWIEDHKAELKPPVGNKQVFFDSTFIVMVVAGPNSRTDFHVNASDEFFYQMEGDIFLRVITKDGKIEEVPILEGDIFMLKAGTPHSPQREAGSIGLVIEKTRVGEEIDGLQWYCAKCQHKLYEEFFKLTDIEKQFGAVFERYFNSTHTKCKKCGHLNGRTWNPQ